MRILFIINDAPYGSEKACNALRMAMTLQKEHPVRTTNSVGHLTVTGFSSLGEM